MLLVLYAVIHEKDYNIPYMATYHVWDVFHVLLLLGRIFVFGICTKTLKTLKPKKPKKTKNLKTFLILGFSSPNSDRVIRRWSSPVPSSATSHLPK